MLHPLRVALLDSDLLLSAQESGGPPVGLQVFVGTLALFAVPVVAWSLYTLNTTGNISLVYSVCMLAMPHTKTQFAQSLAVRCIRMCVQVCNDNPIAGEGDCDRHLNECQTVNAVVWVGPGCGLPPGPGGALGALEGVSYVTLLGVVAWSIGMKATTSKGLPPGALPSVSTLNM